MPSSSVQSDTNGSELEMSQEVLEESLRNGERRSRNESRASRVREPGVVIAPICKAVGFSPAVTYLTGKKKEWIAALILCGDLSG